MDFIKSFKTNLLDISPTDFESQALSLFRFQARNNPVYNEYLKYLKRNPDKTDTITEIPFLPVSLFKNHKVLSGDQNYSTFFQSSGTTGMERSRHYIKDPELYEKVAVKAFENIYGSLENIVILALLPSYLENPHSSLIFMINDFAKRTGQSFSPYISGEVLFQKKDFYKNLNKKLIVFGVTYSLLDLAEFFPGDFSDFIFIETGGMKGRRKEITRSELHDILKESLNISSVHSEYGMTELLSQAYAKNEGRFITPPWMKVFVREINDPFSLKLNGSGGINIIDLANVDSCAFIEIQDLGRIHNDQTFEVLGRFDNSDTRGCNLLIQ